MSDNEYLKHEVENIDISGNEEYHQEVDVKSSHRVQNQKEMEASSNNQDMGSNPTLETKFKNLEMFKKKRKQ